MQPSTNISAECVTSHYVTDLFGEVRAKELLEAVSAMKPGDPLPEYIAKTDLWQACVQNISIYRDESHGVLTRSLPKNSWSMVFASVNQMPTLLLGLKKFVELVPVLQCGISARLNTVKDGTALTICYEDNHQSSTCVERYIELVSFYFQCFLAWTSDKEWLPIHIRLSGLLDPADGRMLEGIRHCRYSSYGHGVTFTYHSDDLQIPLGIRPSDRWAMNETVVFNEVVSKLVGSEQASDSIVGQVQQALEKALMTQSALAEHLCISVPTLQRKLARAGTSYRSIYRQARSHRLSLLLATSMNLDDVAYEMGFSDRRSLTRASRQWFGLTPSAYRKLITTD